MAVDGLELQPKVSSDAVALVPKPACGLFAITTWMT